MTTPAAAGAIPLLLRRRLLRRAVIAAITLAFAALLLVGLVFMLVAAALNGGAGSEIGSVNGLPAAARPWVPLVNLAGKTFAVNPYLLLAVLKEETYFGTHPSTYGPNFLGCCYGPFQINLTDGPPSTWDGVKNAYRAAPRPAEYVHPASPHPSVYDSFDATMAAALVLRRKVGGRRLLRLDQTAWLAARGYQGSGPVATAYADRVLATARSWAKSVSPPSLTPVPSRLAWPVRGAVTSPFGMRWGRLHAGIDIAAPSGTPIRAAANGQVIQRGWVGGYGNFTCLAHGVLLATCYAHQSRYEPGLVLGGAVARDEVIGYVGCSGHCFGPHVHFEVHTSTVISNATAVDPMPYLGAAP
jgi:murein DD-endopeptidase MepM/ murein hydrolase activator NlpD